MLHLKYALVEQIKRLSGLDEADSFREYMRAWLELLIFRGMYDVGRLAGEASPCSCGRHHVTPDGNLFYVAILADRDFQRVKDSRNLPGDTAAAVRAKLADTQHLAADVVVVSREACETGELPFHIAVDRDGYTIRRLSHTVKEA